MIADGIQFFTVFTTLGLVAVLTGINWLGAFGVIRWNDDLRNRFQMLAIYGILMILVAIYFKL